jgi:hypothetical protein
MQEEGVPLHSGPPLLSLPAPALAEAKTESFLTSRVEPHRGQRVPFHSLERTRISLSASHALQWNS